MHRVCYRAHVVDGSEDVRHVRACDELDFGTEKRLQVLGRELQTIFFRRLPPLDCKLEPLGHEEPWLDIGLVFHLRQDDFISFLELKSCSEVHEKLGR
jgi:hypothetical protein